MPKVNPDSKDRAELMKQQASDETLESIRAWEEQEEKFVAGLLEHIEEDALGWEMERIILPQQRRAAKFQIAHTSAIGSRLGYKRTVATIRRTLYLARLVQRYEEMVCIM